MKNFRESSDFKFSQSELIRKSEQVANSVQRDIAEFQLFNVDETKLEAFIALINAYKTYPQDAGMLAAQSIAVERKETARAELLNHLRKLMLCVAGVYGVSTTIYKGFKTRNMYNATDSDLVRIAENAIIEAEKRMSDLAEFGFYQENLDFLKVVEESFDDALKVVFQKSNARNFATEERTRLGNRLYSKLVIFATLGRGIWHRISESHYNDYILYDSPPDEVKLFSKEEEMEMTNELFVNQ